MRILFVHDSLGDLGGAEANVRHVSTALAERGHSLALLHGKRSGNNETRFKAPFEACFNWQDDRQLLQTAAWQADIVYVHKLSSLSVLTRLVASGLPLVRMVHDHDMWCQRGARYFPWNRRICTRPAGMGCAAFCGVVRNRESRIPIAWRNPADKLAELALCRQFAATIVNSSFMAKEAMLNGIDGKRITVLPPVSTAAPPDFTADLSSPTVLYVGQILRGKGVDHLIQALPAVQTAGWQALIIGDGPYKGVCEALSAKLGLQQRVRFTGRLPQDELHKHYASARVLVVPSLWPEPLAMVGLEGMALGLPVAGYAAGGITDWLHDGQNGFAVPVGDTKALAQAIDRLLADRELASKLGLSGQQFARRHFDFPNYIARVEALLTDVRQRQMTT